MNWSRGRREIGIIFRDIKWPYGKRTSHLLLYNRCKLGSHLFCLSLPSAVVDEIDQLKKIFKHILAFRCFLFSHYCYFCHLQLFFTVNSRGIQMHSKTFIILMKKITDSTNGLRWTLPSSSALRKHILAMFLYCHGKPELKHGESSGPIKKSIATS